MRLSIDPDMGKKPPRLSQTTFEPEDIRVTFCQMKKAGIRSSKGGRCSQFISCIFSQDSGDEYSDDEASTVINPGNKPPASINPNVKRPNGKQSTDKTSSSKESTNGKPTSKQPNYERSNGDQPTDKTSSSKESAGINPDDKRPNVKRPSGKQPTDKTSSGKQPNDEKPTSKTPNDKKPHRLSQTTLGPEDSNVSSRQVKKAGIRPSNADRCYKCASCVLGQDSDDEYSNNGKATNEKPTSKQPNYERPNGDQPTDKTSSSKESAGINLDDKRPNDKKPSGKPPNDENSDNGYQSPVKKASQYPSTNNVISKGSVSENEKEKSCCMYFCGGCYDNDSDWEYQ
ncbi:hypothetical protein BASA61_001076 [Batrachochytrium salamandrivorans]|nr:hypothetical protein BASA61_001076 [Batrachochytrium salamandrivorans]